MQGKTCLHHAVHRAKLHLLQNKFKQFLHPDPGQLDRGQFFVRQKQRLHGRNTGTVQMHPVVVPAALPRCGAVALCRAAVEQQCLPGLQHDMVPILLDETGTPEGVEQDIAFFIGAGGGEPLLCIE